MAHEIKARRIKPVLTKEYLRSYKVRNKSGVDIDPGSIVVRTGVEHATFFEVELAIEGGVYDQGKLFVAENTIPYGELGIVRDGALVVADTTGHAKGTRVVLSSTTAGAWEWAGTLEVGEVMVEATEGLVLLEPDVYLGRMGGAASSVSSVNGQTGVVSLSLNDLSDVLAGAPALGTVLTFNGTSWVPQTPASAPVQSVAGKTGNVTLNTGDMTDINLGALSDGDHLAWDTATSKWIPEAPPVVPATYVQTWNGASGAVTAGINALSDVDTTGVVVGDALLWDGATWAPSAVGGGGGNETLAQTLVLGNSTGGTDISLDGTDKLSMLGGALYTVNLGTADVVFESYTDDTAPTNKIVIRTGTHNSTTNENGVFVTGDVLISTGTATATGAGVSGGTGAVEIRTGDTNDGLPGHITLQPGSANSGANAPWLNILGADGTANAGGGIYVRGGQGSILGGGLDFRSGVGGLAGGSISINADPSNSPNYANSGNITMECKTFVTSFSGLQMHGLSSGYIRMDAGLTLRSDFGVSYNDSADGTPYFQLRPASPANFASSGGALKLLSPHGTPFQGRAEFMSSALDAWDMNVSASVWHYAEDFKVKVQTQGSPTGANLPGWVLTGTNAADGNFSVGNAATGLATLSSSGAANDYTSCIQNGAAGGAIGGFDGVGGVFNIAADYAVATVMRTGAFSNGNTFYRFGTHSTTDNPKNPTDGIGIAYNPASGANWQLMLTSGGVSTYTDTGVAATDDTYFKLSVEVDSFSGLVYARINGEVVASVGVAGAGDARVIAHSVYSENAAPAVAYIGPVRATGKRL